MINAQEIAKSEAAVASAKEKPSHKQNASKVKKAGQGGKQDATRGTRKPAAPRPGTKGAKILGMLARAEGATLAQMMKASGWQPHSVRGFLATAPKRHHFKLESVKNDKGERVYRVSQ